MNWRTVVATILGLGLLAAPVMAQGHGWMLLEPLIIYQADGSVGATRFKTHAACNAYMQQQMKVGEKITAMTCDEALGKGYTAEECARWNLGRRNGELAIQGMQCISHEQFESSYTEVGRQRMGGRTWVYAYPN